jgi:hypothetical protein
MRKQVVKDSESQDYIYTRGLYCYLCNNIKLRRKIRRRLNKSYRKQLKNELRKEIERGVE